MATGPCLIFNFPITLNFINNPPTANPSNIGTTPTDCTDSTMQASISVSKPNNVPTINVDFTIDNTIYIGTVNVVLPSSNDPTFYRSTGLGFSNPSFNPTTVDDTSFSQNPNTSISFNAPLSTGASAALYFTVENPGQSNVNVTGVTITLILPQQNSNQIGLPTQPAPATPGQDFCIDPTITIFATLSPTNADTAPGPSGASGDVLQADFLVRNNQFFREVSSNNCYQGCTTPIDNGTRFTVYTLFVGCAIRGPLGSTGSLFQKFPNTPEGISLRQSTVGYGLTKLILGRLTTGEFNIKWLYQCHYDELRRLVFNSQFRSFVNVLDMFFELNQYFFCCDQ